MTTNVRTMFGEIQGRAVMLDPMPMDDIDRQRRPQRAEVRGTAARRVDDTLEDSFPASDPPSWTSSVAQARPSIATSSDRTVQRLLRRVAAMF